MTAIHEAGGRALAVGCDLTSSPERHRLVADLGAAYHSESVERVASAAMPDVIIEATGVPSLVFDAMRFNAACGIVCLTGVSPTGRPLDKIDLHGKPVRRISTARDPMSHRQSASR